MFFNQTGVLKLFCCFTKLEKMHHMFEMEKLAIKREFENKKKSIHRNNEATCEKLKDDFHRQMSDLNNKFKARVDQVITVRLPLDLS